MHRKEQLFTKKGPTRTAGGSSYTGPALGY